MVGLRIRLEEQADVFDMEGRRRDASNSNEIPDSMKAGKSERNVYLCR